MVNITQLCIVVWSGWVSRIQFAENSAAEQLPKMLKYPFIPTNTTTNSAHTLPCNTRLRKPVNPSSPIPVNPIPYHTIPYRAIPLSIQVAPYQSIPVSQWGFGRYSKEFYGRNIPHILITTSSPLISHCEKYSKSSLVRKPPKSPNKEEKHVLEIEPGRLSGFPILLPILTVTNMAKLCASLNVWSKSG